MWSRLSASLRDIARCWAVDLAGFGRSPIPRHIRPDLDAHVAWLAEFMEMYGIRPRLVIGHSMGGMLALKLAYTRPDLIERIALMCPVVTGRFAFNANQVFTSQLWMLMSAKTEKFWSLIQSDPLAPVFSAPLYVDRTHWQRYVSDFQATRWHAAIGALESIANSSIEARLAQIHQPTLVVVGARDFTVPPEEGRMAARLMPNARLVEFETAHHQPLDELPERFSALVRDFLLRYPHF
jgi:pimeloyl-ACP methyl ester carboxylesterase